jgi:hypothetical protein
MSRCAIAFIAFAALFWAAPASAHGCHHGWSYTPQEDWHSHDRKCQPHLRFSASRAKQPSKRAESEPGAKFKMNALGGSASF